MFGLQRASHMPEIQKISLQFSWNSGSKLTEKLVLAGADDGKVFWSCLAADEIHGADEGLFSVGIEAGHDGVDEEGAEPPLVQHVRQHGGESLGRHLSALGQLVHVLAKLHLLLHSLNVGRETSEAEP